MSSGLREVRSIPRRKTSAAASVPPQRAIEALALHTARAAQSVVRRVARQPRPIPVPVSILRRGSSQRSTPSLRGLSRTGMQRRGGQAKRHRRDVNTVSTGVTIRRDLVVWRTRLGDDARSGQATRVGTQGIIDCGPTAWSPATGEFVRPTRPRSRRIAAPRRTAGLATTPPRSLTADLSTAAEGGGSFCR